MRRFKYTRHKSSILAIRKTQSNIRFVSLSIVPVYGHCDSYGNGQVTCRVNATGTFKTSLIGLSTGIISEMQLESSTCCLATISRVQKLVSCFILSFYFLLNHENSTVDVFPVRNATRRFPIFGINTWIDRDKVLRRCLPSGFCI